MKTEGKHIVMTTLIGITMLYLAHEIAKLDKLIGYIIILAMFITWSNLTIRIKGRCV